LFSVHLRFYLESQWSGISTVAAGPSRELARQGRAICGGIVIGIYLLALLAELAAILLTGSAIPLGEPAG